MDPNRKDSAGSEQPGKRKAGPHNSRVAAPVRTVVEKAKEGAKAKGREPHSPPEKQEKAKGMVRERVERIKGERGKSAQAPAKESAPEGGEGRGRGRGEGGRDDFKARMLERREARRRERGEEPEPRDR